MAGTIVCGVGDSEEGRDAIQLAVALRRRLGQRLVLVHVGRNRQPGTNLLEQLSADFDLEDEEVEFREGIDDSAQSLAQMAAEEGADLIVLWSRRSLFPSNRIVCKLALELEALTTIPVVIAPPQTIRRSGNRLVVN
jgi:nucleotide-binding universal stress UspA family protein